MTDETKRKIRETRARNREDARAASHHPGGPHAP